MKGIFRPFFGNKSEKYKFLRVPIALFEDPKFADLSLEAIVLYAFLLNRMDLSKSNGWIARDKRVFIIFTIKEIRKWLRCGKDKAMKTMRELDTDSGIGLVDRMSREAGKSDIIFVNDFNEYVETGESDGADRTIPVVNPIMEDAVFGDEYGDEYSGQTVGKNEAVGFSDRSCEGHPNDMPLNNGFTDHDNFSQVGKSDHPVGKSDPWVGKTDYPVGKSDPPVGNHDPRYTDSKNTETEYTESDHILSAHSSGVIHILPPKPKDRNDEMIENRRIYEEIIKEQIGYDYIFTENSYKFEKDTIDGIIDIMVDIVTFERKTVRVNSIDMPYQVVKSKFLKIDAESFRYALDKLKESGIGRSVGNEKNYIITVLYNASDTIDFHFRAMVNHDMYGDGLAERGIKIQ